MRRKIVPYSHEAEQATRELGKPVAAASVHEPQAMPTRCSTRVLQRWLEIAHMKHLLEKFVGGAVRDFQQCTQHSDVTPQF